MSFVSTSVDRITPRPRRRRIAAVEADGWLDAAPVVTEPFHDWVLSGDFPAGRPDWESAGARFVDDIEPFERRKLWLLNGAHSLLAYAGLLRAGTAPSPRPSPTPPADRCVERVLGRSGPPSAGRASSSMRYRAALLAAIRQRRASRTASSRSPPDGADEAAVPHRRRGRAREQRRRLRRRLRRGPRDLDRVGARRRRGAPTPAADEVRRAVCGVRPRRPRSSPSCSPTLARDAAFDRVGAPRLTDHPRNRTARIASRDVAQKGAHMLKPQTCPTRELVSLDGLWTFALDYARRRRRRGPPRSTRDSRPPCRRATTTSSPTRRIRDHVGWVWYQRTVRVPRGWAGERIFVRARRRHARGRRLRRRHQGRRARRRLHAVRGRHHRPRHARRGVPPHDRRQQRAHQASRSRPGSITVADDGRRQQKYLHDFYNYAGLARSVWLVQRPAVHVADITVVTRTSTARRASSTTTSRPTGDAEVRVRLRDAAGADVAASDGRAGALRGRRRRRSGSRAPPTSTTLTVAGGRRTASVVDSYSPAGRRPHARGARHRVPHQRRAVLLHRLRQARGHRRPRQGPRQRLPRARLPAHGLDRRELVPHLALPLRRGGHGVRRPPRHRRDRRDRRRRAQPRRWSAASSAAAPKQTCSPETINDARAGRPRAGDPRARRPRQEPPQRRDVVDHERAGLERGGRARVLRAARGAHPRARPDPPRDLRERHVRAPRARPRRRPVRRHLPEPLLRLVRRHGRPRRPPRPRSRPSCGSGRRSTASRSS